MDMGKFYAHIFDNRLESDYSDWMEIEDKDIRKDLNNAEELINKITILIKEQ